MINEGIWPVVGQVALPDTTPLTERIASNRLKVGNEVVRSVADKAERATYVSANVVGQRFIENIVRQHLGLVEKQSLFMLQARDATAALLARCRKLTGLTT